MAQQTNKQLRTEFIYGFSQYLDVLLAQDQEQELQRNLLEAVQEQYEIRISLYRALAGDFEVPPPNAEANKTQNQ
jgi:outer membrane protein TolC